MELPPSFDDGRPPFDRGLARELMGKHVLVGVTTLDHKGKLIEHKQFHGTVTRADPRDGFRLALLGEREEQFESLPPDTRAFVKARPGEYRLKATGELVVDPDYTAMWTVKKPPPKKKNV
jgi:hypothetical protein